MSKMEQVTVIVATGARVSGPCRVKLSKEQHKRRAHVLGDRFPKGGVFDLDGGEALQFKLGEKFGLDMPDRLNRQLFEVAGDAAERGAEKKTPAKKEASATGGGASSDDDKKNDGEGGAG